ncbi:uncharacterized protein METZ01_LOCUS218973 [marine metagenome]|uniref:Uncharacterized protein n=1 Tax=marine metagenome TaxID=408172 RepID=A0A382FTY1_9ZZZZ
MNRSHPEFSKEFVRGFSVTNRLLILSGDQAKFRQDGFASDLLII